MPCCTRKQLKGIHTTGLSFLIFHYCIPTWAWKSFRKFRRLKSSSLISKSEDLITECNEACCCINSSPSQSSTAPCAMTGLSSWNHNTNIYLTYKIHVQLSCNKMLYSKSNMCRSILYIRFANVEQHYSYNLQLQVVQHTGSFSPSCEITAKILSYSFWWNSASLTLSNTPSRCDWKNISS